jgi:hypothetical protein
MDTKRKRRKRLPHGVTLLSVYYKRLRARVLWNELKQQMEQFRAAAFMDVLALKCIMTNMQKRRGLPVCNLGE